MRMYPTILRSIAVAACCMAGSVLWSQDTLFYTNGSFVTGVVEEIGTTQVRYRTSSAGNSVVVVADRRDLGRVRLASGQSILITPVSAGLSPEEAKLTHAFKLDFLAPALNHATIGYEHVLSKRVNLELKVGLIGLGDYGDYQDNHGVMGKAGIKFIQRPSHIASLNSRPERPLEGFYLRPELMVSSWRSTYSWYYYPAGSSTGKVTYTSAAINLVIGKQMILGERFTFDVFAGMGYGAQWRKVNGETYDDYSDNYNWETYAFSHTFFGSRSPLTASAGLMLGCAF